MMMSLFLLCCIEYLWGQMVLSYICQLSLKVTCPREETTVKMLYRHQACMRTEMSLSVTGRWNVSSLGAVGQQDVSPFWLLLTLGF